MTLILLTISEGHILSDRRQICKTHSDIKAKCSSIGSFIKILSAIGNNGKSYKVLNYRSSTIKTNNYILINQIPSAAMIFLYLLSHVEEKENNQSQQFTFLLKRCVQKQLWYEQLELARNLQIPQARGPGRPARAVSPQPSFEQFCSSRRGGEQSEATVLKISVKTI